VALVAALAMAGLIVGSLSPPQQASAATSEFELLAEIRLPNTAADWINVPVTVAGSTVFVADDSRIYTMGVDQLTLDDTLTLPSGAGTISPWGATSLGGKAFFAYRTRQVVAVDASTKAVTVIPAVCGSGARIVPWITTYADRVYVGCDTAAFVARIDPVSLTVDDTFATGAQNKAMTVVDDTAYITNDGGNSVTPVDLRTDPPTPASTIAVGTRPHYATSFDDTVFVTNYGSSNMSVIKTTVAPPTTSTISVGSAPVPVAACGTGIYTARRGTSEVMYVNPVTQAVQSINSPAFSDPHNLSADQGTVWVLSVNNDRVATIDCDSRTVDDSVSLSAAADWPISIAFSPYRTFVTSVGGTNGYLSVIQTGTPPTPNQPDPPPPVMSSPPASVAAIAGDGSAAVSWTAPVSSGSFAVSHYLATSSPSGRTCLVAAPALACEVRGLSNGTAYTFTVKALTGAGWSDASTPSSAVTPEATPKPTITITGSREGQRIEVSGATTGFGMGGELKPWIRPTAMDSFTQGAATILVGMDGTFEWVRRAGRQVSVYVATPDGSVRSNTVTIRGR
jgi:hypothetical protein